MTPPNPDHPGDSTPPRPLPTAMTSPGIVRGSSPGEMIGPYKLLELIGEGGFGYVWRAERREPFVQRVALKVIKPGMDSRGVLARFDQERQALAVMDHPNVARVVDGGLTSPEQGQRPYFVMEYVKGEPITTYCDRNRLSLRERLKLFIPVCEAVQHAHHKGIIHRDIKPSNVLVTVVEGRAAAKVIDFGVAKAMSHTLTEHSILTEHGQLIGTPEYMSPEQAEMGGTDIDTRTDVYSLGVLLYELLTGRLPFESATLRAAALDEVRRIIREQEPPKPSTRLTTLSATEAHDIASRRQSDTDELAKTLRRELDWIPLKAMRKDRARRYTTPGAIAEDIQRYLDDKPIEAAPESRAYLLKKFVRRYRGGIVAASAVAAALLLGVVVSLAFMTKAELRRIEAEEARLHADEQTRLAEDRLIEVSQQKARAEQIVRMLHLLSAAQTSLHDPGYNGDFEEYYGLVRALKAGELADDPTADIALRRAFAAAAEKVKDQEYRNDALLLMEGAVQTASRVHGDAHEVTLGLMREAALAAVAAGNVASEIHWLTERIARLRDSHGGPHAEVVLAMLDLAHARVRLAMPPKEDPGRPWWSDGSPAVATQDADADTHPVPQVASQREAHAEAASTLFEEAKALARGLPDAHMTFDRAASAHAAWLSARGGEVAADRVQMERATFWVQDGPSAANPDAATHALSSVVTELVSRGRHELALEVAKMRIALCDARFHAADWRRGGARTSAARIRIAMGDLDEAEDLLLQAQPILRAWWQSSRSTRDADVENVYHMLIALYERLEAERPGGAYAEHVARWRTELESLHEEGRQRLSLRPAAERARTLNNEAWQVARFAHTAAAAGPGGLQRVVNDATRAVELAPAARELAMYLNTLGVAEFRSGLYQRAVQTLHRAEEAYAKAALPKDTVNLVFIAMAQRRLGLLADADRTRGEYLSRRSQLEALRIGDEYSAWHAEFLAEFGLSE